MNSIDFLSLEQAIYKKQFIESSRQLGNGGETISKALEDKQYTDRCLVASRENRDIVIIITLIVGSVCPPQYATRADLSI